MGRPWVNADTEISVQWRLLGQTDSACPPGVLTGREQGSANASRCWHWSLCPPHCGVPSASITTLLAPAALSHVPACWSQSPPLPWWPGQRPGATGSRPGKWKTFWNNIPFLTHWPMLGSRSRKTPRTLPGQVSVMASVPEISASFQHLLALDSPPPSPSFSAILI